MTQSFPRNTSYGTGGDVNYLPSDVAAHTGNSTGAGQRLCVFDHAGLLTGMDYYEVRKKAPWFVMVGLSGWTGASYVTTLDAGGAINQRLAYQLLLRGWKGFSVEVTEAGAAVTGNGAAHLPGQAKFHDKSRPAYNKDIVYAIQHIKANAGTYGIDPDLGLGIGASSSSDVLGKATLRTFVEGEFGDPAVDSQYGFDPSLRGVIFINGPWMHEVWKENQAIVGAVSAVSPDSDVVGALKGDVDPVMLRGHSPYHYLKTKRGRMVPLYAAYTGASVNTGFQPPHIRNIETDVHPVTMGEIAKRQFPGIHAPTGLPWVTLRSFTVDGTDPGFGSHLCARLPDTTGMLDTALLHDALRWTEQLMEPYLPADHWVRRTRTIFTPGSFQWVLALPPNPHREGDAVVHAGGSGGTDPRYLEVLAMPSTIPEPQTTDNGELVQVNITTNPSDPKRQWAEETKGAVFVRSPTALTEAVQASG